MFELYYKFAFINIAEQKFASDFSALTVFSFEPKLRRFSPDYRFSSGARHHFTLVTASLIIFHPMFSVKHVPEQICDHVKVRLHDTSAAPVEDDLQLLMLILPHRSLFVSVEHGVHKSGSDYLGLRFRIS